MQETLTLFSGGTSRPKYQKAFTKRGGQISEKVMEQLKFTLLGSVFSTTVDRVLIKWVVKWYETGSAQIFHSDLS